MTSEEAQLRLATAARAFAAAKEAAKAYMIGRATGRIRSPLPKGKLPHKLFVRVLMADARLEEAALAFSMAELGL